MLQYTSDQIFNNKSKDQKGPATKSTCNDNVDTASCSYFGIFYGFYASFSFQKFSNIQFLGCWFDPEGSKVDL